MTDGTAAIVRRMAPVVAAMMSDCAGPMRRPDATPMTTRESKMMTADPSSESAATPPLQLTKRMLVVASNTAPATAVLQIDQLRYPPVASSCTGVLLFEAASSSESGILKIV